MSGPAGSNVAGAPAPMALFRVAAGPRIGHGHLRRAEVLARLVGVSAVLSVRGTGARAAALPVCPLATPAQTLDRLAPRVLVVDDPHLRHAEAWTVAAQRRGIPVVSVHDLGIARVASTLAVDGSVTSPATGWPASRTLRGLRYAVVSPPSASSRRTGDTRRVLVSLGGGRRGRLTRAVAFELARRHPDLEVLVAGDAEHVLQDGPVRLRYVCASRGLGPWFARVDAAVVGGGVTLYEAVAAGLPTVALAVVPAQRPTVRAFAARRLTKDAGLADPCVDRTATRVAQRLEGLRRQRAWVAHVRAEGPRVIDGQGARRVSRAILALAGGGRRG